MKLMSWLKSRLFRTQKSRRMKAFDRKPRLLEKLEDRSLLAVFHVALAPLGSDTNDGLTAMTPFRTVQKGISQAAMFEDGDDTVKVAMGTYDEAGNDLRLTIQDPGLNERLDKLQLLGGWNTAFTVQTPQSTIYRPQVFNADSNNADVSIFDSGVTIDNFHFDFDGPAPGQLDGTRRSAGISSTAANFHLKNNKIDIGVSNGGTRSAGLVTTSGDQSNLRIENNTFSANAGNGSSATRSTGIFLNPDPARATQTLIHENTFTGSNLTSAIIVDRIGKVDITNNTMSRVGDIGTGFQLIVLRVRDASSLHTANALSSVNIKGNTIDGGGTGVGIQFSDIASATQGISGVVIENNFIQNNQTGLAVGTGPSQLNSISAKVFNNAFSANSIDNIATSTHGNTASTDINASGNWWGVNTEAGVNETIGNEVQSVTVRPGVTSGQFSLTYGAETTAGINHDATAAVVEAALLGLGAFDPGDVTVIGGGAPGIPYVIYFNGAFTQTDVAQIVANPGTLGPALPPAPPPPPLVTAGTVRNGDPTPDVDYTPFLDSDSDVGGIPADGFQGDFSTLHVTDSGAQFPLSLGRIQEGINLVTASTVIVEAGTYNEGANVNKSVTLLGAQAGVDARTGRIGADESVISNAGGAFAVNADDVTIDGFTIQDQTNPNAAPGFGYAIYLAPNYTRATITNNIVQDNIIGLALANTGVDQTTIQNNLFRDNDNAGPAGGHDIYADNSTAGGVVSNVLIDSNLFTNTAFNVSRWAIGMSNVGVAPFTGLTISNNEITNHGRGMYFFNTASSTVSGNDISGATRYAIGLFGSNGTPANSGFTISNNTLANNTKGVYVGDDTAAAAYSGTLNLSGNSYMTAGSESSIFNESATPVDATGDIFNGVPASTATTAQQFVIVDTIVDGVDVAGAGLVRTKAGNVYVTPNSFSTAVDPAILTPTTSPSIQRGINVASAGDTVHVQAGTYVDNLIIDKPLELAGAGQGQSIIVPAVSNADTGLPSSLPGSNIILVQASDIHIHGFTLDGDNPSLTSGTIRGGVDLDARNGIITNHPAGVFNNLEVNDTEVKNIYLRGIYASSGGTFNFHDNFVHNVQGEGASIAMFNFGGSGFFTNNTVTDANDGIASNWSTGTVYEGNFVTNSGSGIHSDNNGGFGGVADEIKNNYVSAGSIVGGSYGIWVFAPYRAVSVHDNTVSDVDVGLGAFGSFAPVTVSFERNSVDANHRAGSFGAWVSTTIFEFGSTDVSASFTDDNTIINADTGIFVEQEAGFTATATITGNSASIHGNVIGIDVNGGAAAISGNHIYDNSTGIRFTNGGSGSVAGNDFDGVSDNGTDLRLDSTAGTVTIVAGNSFAGDGYYIDNQSAQNYDLTSGTTFDETNNFRIEDKLFHKPDAAASGLIRVVAGNIFVTSPGTGLNDETIQGGVDAASSGDTVIAEAGTYTENVNVNKSVAVIGAGSGALGSVISAASGNVVTVAADDVSLESLRVTGAAGTTNGIYFDSSVDSTTLTDVVATIHKNALEVASAAVVTNLDLTNVDLTSSTNGFHVATTGHASDVSVTGGNFSSNQFGLHTEADVTPGAAAANKAAFQTVSFDGTTFSGNAQRAMYLEKLDDATFTSVTVSASTSTTAIDVNLKNAAYSGLAFDGGSITNTSTGTGLYVKARNDGIYAPVPASLSGVSLDSLTVTSNGTDISFQNNVMLSPTTFSDVVLNGPGVGIAFFGSPAPAAPDMPPQTVQLNDTAFNASLGLYVINTTANTVDGTGASFGGIAGGNTLSTANGYAVTDKVFDRVDVAAGLNPFGLVRLRNGHVYVTPNSFNASPLLGPFATTTPNIQRAVDAATSGDTVHIQGGTYTGSVSTVGKAVTLDPGTSPAQVTNIGNLTLDANDKLVIEVNGSFPGPAGAQFDNLIVSGTVTLGGATLAASGTGGTADGNVLVLIKNDNAIPVADPVGGVFAGRPEGSTVVIGSRTYVITYKYNAEAGTFNNGNDVALIDITGSTAPAPGTIVLVTDPCDPSKKALVVTGTLSDDHIDVKLKGSQVEVTINPQGGGGRITSTVPLASITGHIIVYGLAGNDKISIDNKITKDVMLFGDDLAGAQTGNDHIQAGGGNSLQVGGSGDDHLQGGKARDVLIGGLGADLLQGFDNDDILIAGYTDHDDDLLALCEIMERWTVDDGGGASAYNARRVSLSALLNNSTVHDDNAIDNLEGQQGKDWFFANLIGTGAKDKINGAKDSGETTTEL